VSDSTGTATGVGGSAAERRPRKERGEGRVRGIGTFYKQVVSELGKVIWPTRNDLLTYTSVVLVFVLVMVAVVSVFDFAFGQAVIRVFGK